MSAVTTAAAGPAALRRAARRERRVLATLVALVAAIAAASLSLGGYPMSLAAVARALAGAGSGLEGFVVNDVRLPRLVLALLVGAALALAGALLQALLDNPLASPDIVGITGGASVGAVWAIMVAGLGGAGVVGAALAGAAVTALAIHLLAWREGISGQRFVLIGVGVAFMAHGALGYMLTRGDVRDAQVALAWLVGSVGSARWDEIAVLAGALAVLAPAGLACGGALRALQLGDDGARALGLRVDRARLAVIGVAVALVAAATAFAGPVAFVGFLGAPIARRLVGGARPALAPAALVGAVIVAGADLVGRHLLPGGAQVPVGVVTGVVGAPVLLWLLARGGRGGIR